MVLVVPVYEVEQAGFYYNTAVIDADGTYLGKYRKHHIPQVKGFWEKFLLPPNLGWPVFETAVGRVGVYICYDRHFPEGWRPRPGRRPDRLQPPRPPAGACRPTCGSSSSRRRSPTSTSSPPSTGSASRSTATTTSTARATSSIPRPARRRRRQRPRRRARRARPRLRHDRRGPPALGVLPRPPPRRLPVAGRGARAWARWATTTSSPGTGRSCPRGWRSTTTGPSRSSRARAPRVGLRGQPLPRLLRRDPHHDDRPRCPRSPGR